VKKLNLSLMIGALFVFSFGINILCIESDGERSVEKVLSGTCQTSTHITECYLNLSLDTDVPASHDGYYDCTDVILSQSFLFKFKTYGTYSHCLRVSLIKWLPHDSPLFIDPISFLTL
jgi:hypothetical protein